MVDFGKVRGSRVTMALGAAALLAVGAAGGAGAVRATRPAAVMAPVVVTPAARLASAGDGVVTVRGRVVELFGDRAVVEDASGRAMVAFGGDGREVVAVGRVLTAQGRFADGQLRSSYLVDGAGRVTAVGPRGPGGPGPGRPHGGMGRGEPRPPCAPAAPAGPAGPQAPAPAPQAPGA